MSRSVEKRSLKLMVRLSDSASSLGASSLAGGMMRSRNADSGYIIGRESQLVDASKIGCSMPSGSKALKQPLVAKT